MEAVHTKSDTCCCGFEANGTILLQIVGFNINLPACSSSFFGTDLNVAIALSSRTGVQFMRGLDWPQIMYLLRQKLLLHAADQKRHEY